MINNKYLKEWVLANYPMMEFKDDTDVCELDYLDMDRFADWLVKKLTMPVVSKRHLLKSILEDMDGTHPEYHREVVENYLDDGC